MEKWEKWFNNVSAIVVVVAIAGALIIVFFINRGDRVFEAPLSAIYFLTNDKELRIEYLEEGGVSNRYVSIDKVEVALRTDGESYTSVRFVYQDGGRGYFFKTYFLKRAVILVPLAEDVQAWQVRLEEIRNQIEEATRPCRVLPRGNQP